MMTYKISRYLFQALCLMLAGVLVFGPSSSFAAESEGQGQKHVVSLDYKDADLISALRSFAYSYGLNLVMGKDVEGKVNVTLADVSVDEALEALLTVNGYSFKRKGTIIYIIEGSGTEDMDLETVSIPVNYIDATKVSTLLLKALSDKGSVSVNADANSVIVTDYVKTIEKVRTLLKDIDVRPLQVLIEAKLVDMSEDDLRNYGLSYDSIEYKPTSAIGGIFGRDTAFGEELDIAGGMAGPSNTLSGSQLTVNSLAMKGFTITNLKIDALIQSKKAKLLAAPSILTLNGKEAKIVIGQRYPYTEKTQTTTGTTETTKFVDVGITLRVTPQISSDGWITMVVHPEVSSLTASLDAGPQIDTREADASVRIRNGETLIIGGLIKRENDEVKGKMPILGSIPILGWAFRQYSRDAESKELVVFITPRIMDDAGNFTADREELTKEEALSITGLGEDLLVRQMWEEATNLAGNNDIIARGKDRITRLEQAVDKYRQIAHVFPGDGRSDLALWKAIDLAYGSLRNYDLTKELIYEFMEQFPNSKYVRKAEAILNKFSKLDDKQRRIAERAALKAKIRAEKAAKAAAKKAAKAAKKEAAKQKSEEEVQQDESESKDK